MNKLTFGKGSAKLGVDTFTFSLPAGHTCPGASACLAKVGREGGLSHGKLSEFQCFSATAENMYPKVGAIDWSSPSGQVLISFGAVDSTHYADDPLWQIAEIKLRLLNPHIQAKAIVAAEDWFARRGRALLLYDETTPRTMMLEAYENGFCQGFYDAQEEENEG